MKSNGRQNIGKRGETIAAQYLLEKGYTILEANWRSPYGEIDLITSQDGMITFVEVKTRASKSLGPPEISITPRKLEHLRNSAECYIQQHPEAPNTWRIDAIAIQLRAGDHIPIIVHFENVIS